MNKANINRRPQAAQQIRRGAAPNRPSPRDAFLAIGAKQGFDSHHARLLLGQAFDEWGALYPGDLTTSAMELGDSKEGKVLRLLARAKQKGQVTRRDVVWHHITKNSKQGKALLDRMRDAGVLDYEEKIPVRGGKPSHVYRLAGQ
jgi:hypothetical protein